MVCLKMVKKESPEEIVNVASCGTWWYRLCNHNNYA